MKGTFRAAGQNDRRCHWRPDWLLMPVSAGIRGRQAIVVSDEADLVRAILCVTRLEWLTPMSGKLESRSKVVVLKVISDFDAATCSVVRDEFGLRVAAQSNPRHLAWHELNVTLLSRLPR